ncbi:MAG TPA: serpin family protein [Phycisphaerae bacterium]|nr:serpin family protein [Phycisphaerae bacterium]
MMLSRPRRAIFDLILVLVLGLCVVGCSADRGQADAQCAAENEACTADADCCAGLSCGDDGLCVAAGGEGEGEGEGEPEPPGELVQSAKSRVLSPDVTDDDLAELVGGNSSFAFDLYQEVRGEQGNVFYSPFSISIALAMTYAGARTETEQQMAEALHFTLSQDELHPAFNALDLELASRNREAAEGDDEGFRLNIVNRIWGRTGYTFLVEFLDVLAQNYGAGMSLLDFIAAPDESRRIINDWVADQTEDRIKDLLPSGSISPATVLVLTNAIYFNAAWSEPFDENRTSDEVFHLLDGGEVTVPMMQQVAAFDYAAGDGYQAVELPYEGNELSMVIILPDADRFEEFDGSLDAQTISGVVASLGGRDVALSMPRFTFEWSKTLNDALSELGMPAAFTDADFSGINGVGGLFISLVVHKAFVAVDEEGTEAAAATAVVVGESAAPEPEDPVELDIDRPFVFLIRDIQTGTILFLGRVVDPS